MNIPFIACAAAVALLAGCASTTPPRMDPTYAEAAANRFVATNHEAVDKLIAGFNLAAAGDNPARFDQFGDQELPERHIKLTGLGWQSHIEG